ncbi:hypothetical protein BDZ88DRAFT_406363 [Geranomyces variabilis]|nr:hypothetical protein BDZ88DRAFT_406363 [Geranomyces variabilis]KAJ3139569.1 hypothetical protein HDU90_009070 [Geranomyces variabilis]
MADPAAGLNAGSSCINPEVQDETAFNPFPELINSPQRNMTTEHKRHLMELRLSYAWRVAACSTEQQAIAKRTKLSKQFRTAAGNSVMAANYVLSQIHQDWRQKFGGEPPPQAPTAKDRQKSKQPHSVCEDSTPGRRPITRSLTRALRPGLKEQPLSEKQKKRLRQQAQELAQRQVQQQTQQQANTAVPVPNNKKRHALPPNPVLLDVQPKKKQRHALPLTQAPHDDELKPVKKEKVSSLSQSFNQSASGDPSTRSSRTHSALKSEPATFGVFGANVKTSQDNITATRDAMADKPINADLEEGEIPSDEEDDPPESAASTGPAAGMATSSVMQMDAGSSSISEPVLTASSNGIVPPNGYGHRHAPMDSFHLNHPFPSSAPSPSPNDNYPAWAPSVYPGNPMMHQAAPPQPRFFYNLPGSDASAEMAAGSRRGSGYL